VAAAGAALALVATGILAAPTASAATTRWTVTSPDGGVSAEVDLAGGRLTLTARHGASTVLTVQDLGLRTSVADLSVGLAVEDATTSAVHETYTMVTGKKHTRTVDQTQLRLTVSAPSTSYALVVRASHDGVAYSYELPGNGDFAGTYTVAGEASAFVLPDAGAKAWLQPYATNYEQDHQVSTVGGNVTGNIGYPALFQTSTSTSSDYVFLTESRVTGTYAATHLTHAAGSASYGTELGNPQSTNPVTAKGALATPWRLAIFGALGTVVDSTMVDDLANPDRLAGTDTSWIKPGTSAWSWNMNRGSSPQGNLALQKSFVDLAAKEGWGYTVIDEGWNPDWVPELVRYANARGVDVIAWFHSNSLQTKAARTEWFSKLSDWGVTGIKVDFMDSDSQATFKWYDDILEETAAAHLMINFHGATLPKGMQRTWPQIMSYEGVRGEENGRSAQRNTILPFTRNVVGSMDYTPVVFTNNSETSQAHELALPVLYESGWTHYADNPSAYTSRPVAERFLQQVSGTWDDTRYVSGTPGTSAVIARRSGERWFVGGITNGSQGAQSVPLSFLGDGSWLVHEITDDGSSLAEKVETVSSSTALSLPTVTNGGFVLVACPATPGRPSCYRDVASIPTTTVSNVTASSTTVATGEVVTLGATFTVTGGGPVSDLSFAPDVPKTWQLIEGAAVNRATLADGESVSGTWTLRVGAGGVRGAVALTAAAHFTTASGKQIRSAGAASIAVTTNALSGDLSLSDLSFTSVSVGYGSLTRDVDFFGNPLNMLSPSGVDTTYARGIEVNSVATVKLDTNDQCQSFTAVVGLEQSDSDHPEEHNGSVTFQVRDQDAEVLAQSTSTIRWDSPAVPIDVPLDGVTQLVLYAGDAGNGNNSDHVVFADATLHCQAAGGDTTKPTVGIAVSSPRPAAGGWLAAPVTATLSAWDDDSQLTVERSLDGGSTWAPYSAPLVLTDGTHHVAVRATDRAGNVSDVAEQTISVDGTAPTVAAVVSQTARTVTLTATDAGAGVSGVEYRIGDGAWLAYSAPVVVGDGATVVEHRASDRVGNVATVGSVTVPAKVVTPSRATTTTTVSATKAAYGAAAVLTVRVAAADGRAVSGPVTVREGASAVTTGTVASGTARVALPRNLTVGTHVLTVTFSGTSALLPSTGQARLTVTKAPTRLKATVKPAKVTTKKKARLTVKATSSTKVKVTGKATVVVKKGHKRALKKTVTLKAGKATVKLPRLKRGTWKVTVTYRGSATTRSATVTKKVAVKR